MPATGSGGTMAQIMPRTVPLAAAHARVPGPLWAADPDDSEDDDTTLIRPPKKPEEEDADDVGDENAESEDAPDTDARD